MKWTIKDIKKETDHVYLNFYTVTYEVKLDDGRIDLCPYHVSSRNTKIEDLRLVDRDYKRADACLVGTYTIRDDEIYFLLEKQFRQPLNREVIAFPAGLCDREDNDVIETARREVREETGYSIKDPYLLVPPSPTSEGMSDECNCVVIAKLVEKGKDDKEEFEDISTRLYSSKEVIEMLKDPSIMFSNAARLLLMFMLSQYKLGELK